MKRAWLLALMAMGISAFGICAEAPKPGAKATQTAAAASDEPESSIDRRIKTMTTNLSLSKAQQDAVRKVFEEARKKLADFRDEIAEKHKAIRAETEAKISALLKPDQKKKYLDLKDAEAERRRLSQDAAGK